MKIVYVSGSVIPSRTANSLHVMKMCAALASLGHEVVLLAPDIEWAREPGAGDPHAFYGVPKSFRIETRPWPKYRFRTQVYAAATAWAVHREKPDLVYTRFFHSCVWNAFLGRKTVFESHAPIWEFYRFEGWLCGLLARTGRISHLVVITEALRRAYLEKGWLPPENILVAHDASDEVAVSPKHLPATPGGRLQVGYVGGLYQGKGMEVVEGVAPKLPEADFHIIGGMEKDIMTWRERIKAPNVTFHGFVPQSRLGEEIGKLDVCLLPNQHVVRVTNTQRSGVSNIAEYTSPLKMFEYMAHGKAIVSSDLPVLREVLNESNAKLVNPEKPEEWVAAIRELQDPELRARLGGKARADFLGAYTWRTRAAALLSVLGKGKDDVRD